MGKFEIGDQFTNNTGDLGIIVGFIKGSKTTHRRCLLEFVDGTKITLPTPKIRIGSWKNPNKPIIYNVGYIGQGEYTSSHKGVSSRAYRKWEAMLYRCYNTTSVHYKYYGYVGVEVCENWHNFQNFAAWFYGVDTGGRDLSLDKDIRYPESLTGKLYCPEYCCLISHKVNNMMAGISKIGVRKSNIEGVENYKISVDGVVVFSSYDKGIVECMLDDVYLQKLLSVGRQMERGITNEGTKKDFYKKVVWLTNKTILSKNKLIKNLTSTYKL